MCKESFGEVLRDLQGMSCRVEQFHGPNSACLSAKLACMAVAHRASQENAGGEYTRLCSGTDRSYLLRAPNCMGAG